MWGRLGTLLQAGIDRGVSFTCCIVMGFFEHHSVMFWFSRSASSHSRGLQINLEACQFEHTVKRENYSSLISGMVSMYGQKWQQPCWPPLVPTYTMHKPEEGGTCRPVRKLCCILSPDWMVPLILAVRSGSFRMLTGKSHRFDNRTAQKVILDQS